MRPDSVRNLEDLLSYNLKGKHSNALLALPTCVLNVWLRIETTRTFSQTVVLEMHNESLSMTNNYSCWTIIEATELIPISFPTSSRSIRGINLRIIFEHSPHSRNGQYADLLSADALFTLQTAKKLPTHRPSWLLQHAADQPAAVQR